MKKFSFLLVALLMNAATIFADSNAAKDFLQRYEALVTSVEALNTDNVDRDKVDSLKTVYKKLTKEVSKHKSDMTNAELEQYYVLKSRYQKKIAIIKTKRSASAIKGWVKGMMNE